jgi:hypothetical protein
MTDEQKTPERGDQVQAVPYHADGQVAGSYRPREDFPDAEPPADAAWVEIGDPQGPEMVRADSVRPISGETVRPELRAVRDAAQALADAVRAALATNLQGVRPLRLPQIPMLQIPRLIAPTPFVDETPAPDPRHIAVTVRTLPVLGEPSRLHVYRDAAGLSWQTYGAEHDFGTDRLLEIQDANDDVIGTYPAGTWLHACYGDYLDPTGGQS